MKSFLFTLCLTATSLFASAQYYDGTKITYGLAGGSNYATLFVKAPASYETSTDLISPFSLGFSADVQFNDYFSIRPSIIYQGKGGVVMGSSSSVNTSTITLHYIEVPVDFIGHLPIGDEGANFFLGAGPFISMGLNGTNKTHVVDPSTFTDIEVRNKVKFGSNGDFKSVDYGATAVIGYQVSSGFAVSLNADIGLGNILQKNDASTGLTSIKTAALYVSIGQSF